MTGLQWSRLLASIESRISQFNDLLLKATELVKKFFLCPASTPAVEFSTLPVQLSSNDVSIPTPDLPQLTPDMCQSNTTTFADGRVHRHSAPPEDTHLEEPPLQPRSQSRTEARISLASNPQLPVDGMNAESVGIAANTSSVNLDLSNREQSGGVLALEGSTFHDDLWSPGWLRRGVANSGLRTPDWSSGFGFPTN
jgi:hypothetical protein